jgi:hypothetical protein
MVGFSSRRRFPGGVQDFVHFIFYLLCNDLETILYNTYLRHMEYHTLWNMYAIIKCRIVSLLSVDITIIFIAQNLLSNFCKQSVNTFADDNNLV